MAEYTDRELVKGTSLSERHSSEAPGIERLYYGRHRLTFRVGSYLALVRMMGIGHLVTALYGHSMLVSDTHMRLSRTRQTLKNLICEGFDSSEGREAVRRLRSVHRNIPADAEDFRYVLATFFLEPLRWNERHARIKLTESEKAVLLAFWTRVGRAMEIQELPDSLPHWKQLQSDYEARHMAFTNEGHHLACMSLREVVKLALPIGTRALFRQLMIATIEESVRGKLGLAPPSWFARIAARTFAGAVM